MRERGCLFRTGLPLSLLLRLVLCRHKSANRVNVRRQDSVWIFCNAGMTGKTRRILVLCLPEPADVLGEERRIASPSAVASLSGLLPTRAFSSRLAHSSSTLSLHADSDQSLSALHAELRPHALRSCFSFEPSALATRSRFVVAKDISCFDNEQSGVS